MKDNDPKPPFIPRIAYIGFSSINPFLKKDYCDSKRVVDIPKIPLNALRTVKTPLQEKLEDLGWTFLQNYNLYDFLDEKIRYKELSPTNIKDAVGALKEEVSKYACEDFLVVRAHSLAGDKLSYMRAVYTKGLETHNSPITRK